jgi:hypothetical protein
MTADSAANISAYILADYFLAKISSSYFLVQIVAAYLSAKILLGDDLGGVYLGTDLISNVVSEETENMDSEILSRRDIPPVFRE